MSHFLGRTNGWHFDIPTLIVTLLVVPLVTYFLGILRKHGKTWGGFLFEGACYTVGRVVMHSLAARFTLKRYCRLELQKENKYLYVPSSSDVKLEIDRVFVNLTLEQQSAQTESYDQTTLFKAGNRIRVIGDPGSGKSSLVKRLFRDACLVAIASPSKAKLPLLVELKNISIPNTIASKKLGRWLYDELKRSATKSAVYGMEDCFDNYARVSGLLVLLDGLDEVASAGYARVETAIVGLSELLSNFSDKNTLILTMRTQLHQQIKDAFRSSFGKAFFVKPLSPTDVYEFLSRWPFTDRRVGPSIYAELTDRPTLREMCTNPLVLAMYVAERQSGSDPLTPESRTDFYRKVFDELLVKRRLRQTGPAPLPGKLREQRERILGRVAYEHLLDANQAANSLHWPEAMRVVREVMKCGDQDAEDIFLAISKETGLVSQEKDRETFRFIHLTFCEFLAAHEAVQGQKNGVDRLIDTHKVFRSDPTARGPSRLIEVIPFACGLVQRSLRDDVISKVSALHDDRLLARCFLETKNYEHEAWQKFAETTRDSLLKAAESSWNERWLQDLHLFNVVVRDAAQCAKYAPITGGQIDLGEFYEQLVRKQEGNSLPRLLAAYASHDAPAALRLAEISGLDLPSDFPEIIIDNCDQIPFLSLIVDKLLSDLERPLAWVAPLAEAGLGSRPVAGFLSSKAADVGAIADLLTVIPAKNRWDAKRTTGNSLYTQILTLAVNSPSPPARFEPRFKRLQILRELRPPRGLRWRELSLIVSAALVFALAVCLGVTEPRLLNLPIGATHLKLELWGLLGALLFTLMFYGYLARIYSTRTYYRLLINVKAGRSLFLEFLYPVLLLFFAFRFSRPPTPDQLTFALVGRAERQRFFECIERLSRRLLRDSTNRRGAWLLIHYFRNGDFHN